MPFYSDDRKVVEKFLYKKVYVEISEALRGATHCDLEHEVESMACQGCGEPIQPDIVYLISILGREIIWCESRGKAIEIAKAFLDSEIDQLQDALQQVFIDSGEDDEEEDEETSPIDAKNLPPLERRILSLGWVSWANSLLQDKEKN